ncbi:hypothetical protein M2168_006378 [Streptomyces sp. CZ24]|nr:hypothetical protein [Streptomyces sp. CZ24]
MVHFHPPLSPSLPEPSPAPPLSGKPTPGPPGHLTNEESLMSTVLWIAIGIALLVAVTAGIRKNRG